MILFINACVRKESRTRRLADHLLDKLGLDVDEIVNMKMEQNERKYPIEKAKGNSAKYDQL